MSINTKRFALGTGLIASALVLGACASESGAADYVPAAVVVIEETIEPEPEIIVADYDDPRIYLGNGFYFEEIPFLTIFDSPVEPNLQHRFAQLGGQPFDRSVETLDLTEWSMLPQSFIQEHAILTFINEDGEHDPENGVPTAMIWSECTAEGLALPSRWEAPGFSWERLEEGYQLLDASLGEILTAEAYWDRYPPMEHWVLDDVEFMCSFFSPIEFNFSEGHITSAGRVTADGIDLQIYSEVPIEFIGIETSEDEWSGLLSLVVNVRESADGNSGQFASRITHEDPTVLDQIRDVLIQDPENPVMTWRIFVRATSLSQVDGNFQHTIGEPLVPMTGFLRWEHSEVNAFFDQFRAASPIPAGIG